MHQRPTLIEEEFDPDVAELVDAGNWAEAGNQKLALKTLSKIKDALCESHAAFPMQRCADLMDKLGAKKDALAVALLEQKAILERRRRDVSLNDPYGTPEPAYDCAEFLARRGKQSEALALLKSVKKEIRGTANRELMNRYSRLFAQLRQPPPPCTSHKIARWQ